MSSGDHVRYVVVVHGMGEARKNETLISVANRFAEARSAVAWPPPDDVLTLGRVFGAAAGSPWTEFRGIPKDPSKKTEAPFLGEPNRDPDDLNLRFVDVHWADLLAEDYGIAGQDPVVWTDGLFARLIRRDEAAERLEQERVPCWALLTLVKLRETVALAHLAGQARAKELDETVFGKYLGDVQMYGEHARTRGRAVRRFHETMHAVEQAHARAERARSGSGLGPVREARYTVVAHSLGTVMSFDALLYAHASFTERVTGMTERDNFPFPGYAGGGGPTVPLETSWIRRVDSFVTLGSPIDKFLLIWWLNYRYVDRDDWIDPGLRDRKKILHFNYSDEQDPVGHHLDLAADKKGYRAVFDRKEDVVHVRYDMPGRAHIDYWDDRELFGWILRRAVDLQPDRKGEPPWFLKKVFRKALFRTYTLLPYLVGAGCFFGIAWALRTDSHFGAALIAAGLFAGGRLGGYVMELVLWWRQILRAKDRDAAPAPGLGHALLDAGVAAVDCVGLFSPVRQLATTLDDGRIVMDRAWKERAESVCRGWLFITPGVWLLPGGVVGGTWILGALQGRWESRLDWVRVSAILGVVIAGNILWELLLKPKGLAAGKALEHGPSWALDLKTTFLMVLALGAGLAAAAHLGLDALAFDRIQWGRLPSALFFAGLAMLTIGWTMLFRLLLFHRIRNSLAGE